ncbi:NADH dehydrogenase [ubiquinone] iron-sulfur protein 1, mitochondrial, partial [Tanacetum coccineum]
VDSFLRNYMNNNIIHVHSTESASSSIPDLQQQLYLKMKDDERVSWRDALDVVAEIIHQVKPKEIVGVAGKLKNGKNTNADLHSRYHLNSSIQGLKKADCFLLVGTQPRVEALMANPRIHKTVRASQAKLALMMDDTWTKEDELLFQSVLVMVLMDMKGRWPKINEIVPGKTVEDVSACYEALVCKVIEIELGELSCQRFLDGLSCHKDANTVASHTQKYFQQQTSRTKERKRSSIHDITINNTSKVVQPTAQPQPPPTLSPLPSPPLTNIYCGVEQPSTPQPTSFHGTTMVLQPPPHQTPSSPTTNLYGEMQQPPTSQPASFHEVDPGSLAFSQTKIHDHKFAVAKKSKNSKYEPLEDDKCKSRGKSDTKKYVCVAYESRRATQDEFMKIENVTEKDNLVAEIGDEKLGEVKSAKSSATITSIKKNAYVMMV